jgi:hypothetical protein
MFILKHEVLEPDQKFQNSIIEAEETTFINRKKRTKKTNSFKKQEIRKKIENDNFLKRYLN